MMTDVMFELEDSNGYGDVHDVSDVGEDDDPIQIIRLDQGYNKNGSRFVIFVSVFSVCFAVVLW